MTGKRPWILDSRICWMVLVAFCCLSLLPTEGFAALAESRLSDGTAMSQRGAQIESIRQALEREVVVQRLEDFGLSPAEIEAKLPSLSDAQLHQLAGLTDDLAAGGVLGEVIAVLLIVLLVIVILKVSNKRIIVQ